MVGRHRSAGHGVKSGAEGAPPVHPARVRFANRAAQTAQAEDSASERSDPSSHTGPVISQITVMTPMTG